MTLTSRLDPTLPTKRATGLTRLWKALGYSINGLRSSYRYEEAFRQEVLLGAFLIPLAFVMPVSSLGKLLLVGSVLLVWITELLNSAVEAVVDRVSMEYHELAKHAKDAGSAAVFVSLLFCLMVWVWILSDRFF
ncbi:MAG: diacylglycerol kinase [Gammaproteobacteria bacterium]